MSVLSMSGCKLCEITIDSLESYVCCTKDSIQANTGIHCHVQRLQLGETSLDDNTLWRHYHSLLLTSEHIHLIQQDLVNPILENLRDENPEVRREALEELRSYLEEGIVKEEEGVTALLQVMREDNSEDLRCQAVWGLVQPLIGGTRTIEALEQAMVSDMIRSPDFCVVAAEALGHNGSKMSFAHLENCINASGHAEVVCAACRAAKQFSSERACELLPGVLRSHHLDDARVTAARLLLDIGDSRAAGALLTALQEDTCREVKEVSAMALGALGDATAVPHLEKILQDEAWEFYNNAATLPLAAARSLGEIGAPSAVPSLEALVKEVDLAKYDELLLIEAARSLGALGHNSGVTALAWILHEHRTFPYVRCRAIDAMGVIGDRGQVSLLQSLLNDTSEDPKVLFSAARVLAQFGDASGLAVFEEVLLNEDGNPDDQCTAADALGSLGTKRAIHLLQTATHNSGLDICVRHHCRATLEQLCDAKRT